MGSCNTILQGKSRVHMCEPIFYSSTDRCISKLMLSMYKVQVRGAYMAAIMLCTQFGSICCALGSPFVIWNQIQRALSSLYNTVTSAQRALNCCSTRGIMVWALDNNFPSGYNATSIKHGCNRLH